MNIPTIGFGTWQILLNGKAKRAVTEALETGYRLIDTAMVYGNEKGVGAAIRETGMPRDEIYLTTKLWNSDQGYESGLRAFETSLSRLGLEYIDLYLIHWPRGSELTRQSWKALEEIRGNGLAKNIGVSNYDIEELKELLGYAKVLPAVNQIEFHPFIYQDQKPILDYCKEQGIVVEAYSPLARAKQMNHPVIAEVAEQSGKTAGQVMLRWCVQHGTVPLPKTTHKERMIENLDIFDFELSAEQMEKLDSLSTGKSVL
jgi:diketogulonate reductase-like aldo/keto reductase